MPPDSPSRRPTLALILLAYAAFIALGMPDGLLGVAWPSIRSGFGVPLDAAGLLLAASVAGYTSSSFLSGVLVSRLGVGRILAASCALTGLALTGYTLVPGWGGMVFLGIFAGLGAGAIDAGLNTYAATHFSHGLMQGLHASYGVGVTLGPLIMTASLAAFHAWRPGYRTVGAVQLALALCFALTLSLWDSPSSAAASAPAGAQPLLTDYKTPLGLTLRQGRVWLSVLLFFVYVGAEVTLGTWTYSLLVESRGIDPAAAGLWAGGYWAAFTVGRIAAGLAIRKIGIHRLTLAGIAGALAGSLLLAWNPFPGASLAAVAVIGLSIAPIFPALMSATSRRVSPRFAANTIGLQMAATGLGAAAIPSLTGVLARRLTLEVVPPCLLVAFTALLLLYRLSATHPAAE